MSDAQSNFTPSVASLPTTVLRSYTVKSIPTDVMIQLFADRISIIVTQMNGRVGTLLSVSVEDSVIDMSRTYNISTLLGRRDDAMVDVLARQVAEQIAKLGGERPGMGGGEGSAVCPPIVLGIALKKEASKDPSILRAVVGCLVETYQEAVRLAGGSK